MYSIPDAFLNQLHTLTNLVSLTLGSHTSNAMDHQYQLKTLPKNLVVLQNLKYLNLGWQSTNRFCRDKQIIKFKNFEFIQQRVF